MTKMATMPMYGKIPYKSSPKPASRFPRNLVCSIRDSSPSNFCSNDDPGVTLTYFTARSNLAIYAFLREKVKAVDFSETIAASDLKVGTCRQLIEFMKVCEY